MADAKDINQDFTYGQAFTLPDEASFVTKELLQSALRDSEQDDTLVVTKFELSDLMGKALVSNLLAVEVSVSGKCGTTETHHLVAKIESSPNTGMGAFTRASKLYEREINVYTEVFQAMKDFQVENDLVPDLPSVPRLLTSVFKDEVSLLLMEDLREDGFLQPDIRVGVGFEECKIVLNEYAKFHAWSYAIKNRSPETMKKKFGYLSEETMFCDRLNELTKQFYVDGVDCFVELVKEIVHDEDLLSRLEKFRSLESPQSCLFLEEPFGSLCLRDSSCRNVMIKYDSSNEASSVPTQAKLIDFQLVCYSMPAIDVATFIYSGTTGSLRKSHLNDLLMSYHTAFEKCLRHLNLDFPEYCFDGFLHQFNLAKKIAFPCNMVLSVVLANPEDLISSEPGFKVDGHAYANSLRKRGRTERVTDLFFEAVECGYV